MTTSIDVGASLGPTPAEPDVETSRWHHRIRVELVRILREATPPGWVVVDGTRCARGDDTVELDLAVRALSASEPLGLPLLSIDVHAGGGDTSGPQRARRQSLARLGIDHCWVLDTASRQLDVWVRTDDEYRHAETLTDADWLDYGIGLIHLDLRRLLEA